MVSFLGSPRQLWSPGQSVVTNGVDVVSLDSQGHWDSCGHWGSCGHSKAVTVIGAVVVTLGQLW